MAIEILDEHEQGEVVRRWISQYGGALIGGVVLGIGALIGVQQWQNYGAEQRAEGALQFQTLVEAYESRDLDLADSLTAEIKQRRANTPYAALAALREADAALEAGDQARVSEALRWVVNNSKEPAFKDLANLRLARIHLGQSEPDEALRLVSGIQAGAYAGLAAEIRGDALVDLGRHEEAAAAYRAGLEGDGAEFARVDVIRMKLDSLGPTAAAENES